MKIGDYCILKRDNSYSHAKAGDVLKVIGVDSPSRFKVQLCNSSLKFYEDSPNLLSMSPGIIKTKADERIMILSSKINTIKELIEKLKEMTKDEVSDTTSISDKKLSTLETLINYEENITKEEIMNILQEGISKQDLTSILFEYGIYNVNTFE